MYLGLDVGTTATKAILIDARQRVLGRTEFAYATRHPGPGLCEQDPAVWIDAVVAVIETLRRDSPEALASIEAIGLSGQMHSLVVLGADAGPLCPAILWNDTRGAAECRALEAAVPMIARLTGVIPMPSFTAPKLLWLRRNRPDLYGRIRTVLWPKDFVRLWLTGELATDMSDAAGGQLLDGARRAWCEPVIEAVGLSSDQLPPLLEGTDPAGQLRADVATRLGLRPGIPVAAGGGDAGTGALGLGCVTDGASFLSLGTGATIVVAQAAYAPYPDAVLHDFAHAAPGLWYQMAAMLNGASCLAWAARLCGRTDIAGWLGEVEQRFDGPSRVMFLPYLNGERTPHNDTEIRGSFIGLDSSTDPADIAQAVMEGIGFMFKDAAAALASAGCVLDTPGFVGGGTRSPLWGRIIASMLGHPLARYENADLGPALGAARLAMIVSTRAAVEDVAVRPVVQGIVQPDIDLEAAYADRYETYRALYPALRSLKGLRPGAAPADRQPASSVTP